MIYHFLTLGIEVSHPKLHIIVVKKISFKRDSSFEINRGPTKKYLLL